MGATARMLHARLGFSTSDIGALASVSSIVGVAATIPIGIAADRYRRVRLLRWAVATWSVGMIWVGATSTLAEMLPARAALGALTAAIGPVTVSLIGDTVAPADRGWVFGRVLTAQLCGSAAGVAMSGEVAGLFGWRWAFWWLAGAGALALWAARGIGEPDRVGARAARRDSDRGPSTWRAFIAVLRIRTNLLLVGASALAYFFLNGVAVFSFVYLHARFGVAQTVAPFVMLTLGAAAIVGVLSGSRLGDRWARRSATGRIYAVWMPYSAAVALIVPGLLIHDLVAAVALLALGAGMLGAANPNLDAARVDIVPRSMLGRAESVRTVLRSGADAFAPAAVGLASAALGLSVAFQLLSVPLVVAATLGAVALRTYARDATAVDREPLLAPASAQAGSAVAGRRW